MEINLSIMTKDQLKKFIVELEEENKKLKEDLDKREYYDKVNGLNKFIELSNEMADIEKENKKLREDYRVLGILNDEIRRVNENLREENKKLKDRIQRLEFDVDAWHQLKLLLEGEIERLRGLQICGKTVAERIEEDKKVVRE